ncbi:hypothetical protein MXD81_22455, partial [Microbacteriaceae bacterium K1510]|nr:hypothetical protein [Microbacteriaceae bacterium K1510]
VNVDERAIDFEIVGMKKANNFRPRVERKPPVNEGRGGASGRNVRNGRKQRKETTHPAVARKKRAERKTGTGAVVSTPRKAGDLAQG